VKEKTDEKEKVDEMKKSKCKEEQIAFALELVELGTPISEGCQKLMISEQPIINLLPDVYLMFIAINNGI